MPRLWLVRAGEAGYLLPTFRDRSVVAIGWAGCGDFTPIDSLTAMRQRIESSLPDLKPGALANSAGMAWKFRGVMQVGDRVVTYDPKAREYLLGTITGDYRYAPGQVPDSDHVRPVRWDRTVGRDALSVSARNTLGSVLTLFEPGEEVLRELEGVTADAGPETPPPDADVTDDAVVIRRDMLDRAHEFIKDRILRLSPEELEQLTAAVLRAMGYKARVTPTGPDRGRDVIASPDGLGFQRPRIVAEVKHRSREAMGAQAIRSFLGGLRAEDNGLYVSTGGFTREARYEADRATVPTTLLDLDDLAALVTEHYDRFDSDGRSLLPLTRIYWPAG